MPTPSSADLILALDVGTSATKAAIFDPQGNLLALARTGYRNQTDPSGKCEQNPEQWWRAAQASIRLACAEVDAQRIRAIAVTALRAVVLPVDRERRPIGHAVLAHDLRAAAEAERMTAHFGAAAIYRRTGLRPSDYFSAPRMIWLRNRLGKRAGRIEMWLGAQEYLIHKLCGETVVDPSQAGRTQLLDVHTLQWDGRFCAYAGVPEEMLPRLVPAASVVGRVDARMAAALSLPQVEVVAAGADQACAALALGGLQSEVVTANHGTGCFLLASRTRPVLDRERRFLCSPHAWRGFWAVEAPMLAAGRQVDDWRRLTHTAMREMDELDRRSPPGSHGIVCVPHMCGTTAPYWNREARGAFCGLRAGQTRHDLMRAMVEGLLFDLAHNLEILGRPRELRVAGGLARCDWFNQLQADICDLPVVRAAQPEATALGAAIAGAVATGVHRDFAGAFAAMARLDEASRKLPGASSREFYRALRPHYDDLVKLIHAKSDRGVSHAARAARSTA